MVLCCKCNLEKDEKDFSPSQLKRKSKECKLCVNEDTIKYYTEHKEEIRIYNVVYNAEHKEENKTRRIKYYAELEHIEKKEKI